MDDLISRRAAIDALNDEFTIIGKTNAIVVQDYIRRVNNRLHDLPSAQTEQRWIPVSERLPEEDKNVLVTVYFKGLVQKHKTGWNDHIKPKSYVEVASQIDGEWHSYSDEYKVARDRHVVTAWMPLPDPYKEEE